MGDTLTAPQEQRKVYKYIDVAKFFGIFAIYLGHLGNAVGPFCSFVFRFHVPLFFSSPAAPIGSLPSEARCRP